MSDTRNPLCDSLHRAPFYSLATTLNYEYALRHDYDFLFYWLRPEKSSAEGGERELDSRSEVRVAVTTSGRQSLLPTWKKSLPAHASYLLEIFTAKLNLSNLPPSVIRPWNFFNRALNRILRHFIEPTSAISANANVHACSHPVFGSRAPAWAKLLCIEDAMSKADYDRIIYIDTDAFFAQLEVDVEQFLKEHAYNDELLVLTNNYPWTRALDSRGGRDANTGFMIWNVQDDAFELLHQWWNTDGEVFNLKHDWEQYAFQQRILPIYSNQILITPEVTFEERRGQYLRHIGSAERRFRRARMRLASSERKWTKTRWQFLNAELERNHLVSFGTLGRDMKVKSTTTLKTKV